MARETPTQADIEEMRADLIKTYTEHLTAVNDRLRGTRNCLRGQNTIICCATIHYDGEPSYLKIIDREKSTFNFSAAVHESPLYSPNDAAQIVKDINSRYPNYDNKVYAEGDVTLLETARDNLVEQLQTLNDRSITSGKNKQTRQEHTTTP